MNRFQRKIFLLLAGLGVFVTLVAVFLTPPGSFSVGTFLSVAGIAAAVSFLLSIPLRRSLLDPFDQITRLSDDWVATRRSSRLVWRFDDERDPTANALNRVADELGGRFSEAQAETARLDAIINAMAEGVLLLDLDEQIQLVNPGFRDLFGAWGPIEGRPVVEVLRKPDVLDLLRDASERAETVVREVIVRGATDRTVLAHAVRFPNEGPPAGTLAVFHDVTDARRVDRIRQDFVANASHELRTPLASIQGFAETLRGEGLSEEDTERCLSTILRNVTRMRNLIDDLMELSRIEQGVDPTDRGPVDLVRIVRELFTDLEKRLSGQKIRATLETTASPPAFGDPLALERVFENLVTNAIRYSDPGGEIRVRIKPETSHLEVTVEDEGIGIPEDSLDRIFERFYRVDASRSRAVGSTGLGLSIVRHLVESMEGTIRVESEIGVGSRFIFTIPRAPDSGTL